MVAVALVVSFSRCVCGCVGRNYETSIYVLCNTGDIRRFMCWKNVIGVQDSVRCME